MRGTKGKRLRKRYRARVEKVKHVMPDGTPLLGWELLSDLGPETYRNVHRNTDVLDGTPLAV